jgi:hypothetical protein
MSNDTCALIFFIISIIIACVLTVLIRKCRVKQGDDDFKSIIIIILFAAAFLFFFIAGISALYDPWFPSEISLESGHIYCIRASVPLREGHKVEIDDGLEVETYRFSALPPFNYFWCSDLGEFMEISSSEFVLHTDRTIPPPEDHLKADQ